MEKEEYNIGIQMKISEYAWEDKKYYEKLKHYNELLHLKFENLPYDWSEAYLLMKLQVLK